MSINSSDQANIVNAFKNGKSIKEIAIEHHTTDAVIARRVKFLPSYPEEMIICAAEPPPSQPPPINFEMVLVTPEMAQGWLNNQPVDRNTSRMFINSLAVQMANEEFICTHQCIAFGPEGVRHDGQHRLHAIVESKKSVWLYIARYTDADQAQAARLVMDIGRKRGIGDTLQIEGVIQTNGKERAAVASLIHMLDPVYQAHQGGSTGRPLTPNLMKQIVTDYADAYDVIRPLFETRLRAVPLSPFVWLRQVNPDHVDKLAAKVGKEPAGLTRAESLLYEAMRETVGRGADRMVLMRKIMRGIEISLNNEDVKNIPTQSIAVVHRLAKMRAEK